MEVGGAAREDPRRPRHPADPAAAAGRRRLPGRLRHRLDRRAASSSSSSRTAGGEGVRERPVHVRRRRPEVRPAAGRGRLRPRQGALAGRRHEPGGARPLDHAGRQLRQPLQHPGAQLQGHPAGQAQRAADAGPARARSTSPAPAGKLVPLSTFATLQTTTEPRELKRFQQLNAVRIQGVIPPGVSLDQALGFLETRRRRSCRRASRIDYAGESRQLRTEGGKFLGDVPALGDPDLPRARGAVRELPRPVHHPGRLGAAGALRRAALLVPRADHAQHLQPGRPDHAGRAGREERHPDRASSPTTSRRRGATSCRRSSRRPARACGRS